MPQKILYLLIVLFFSMVSSPGATQTLLQSPKTFIHNAFKGNTPKAKVYWLTEKDKEIIRNILQHQYQRLRIRYWCLANETVWILDEIGKEKPITVGIHIKDKKIAQLSVLTYRESRGDEVKHNFFTDQFKQATLIEKQQLSKHIDGITGATLSVRALKKVAKMALWLDQQVTTNASCIKM
jgi:hypothetical protein